VPSAIKHIDARHLGRFQLELRRRLIESGDFYIVSTSIDGIGALRVTIINPLTTPEDLDRLLDALRFHGAALMDQHTTTNGEVNRV
jgi:L-2,4-diaminobutyrate decarboxylase